MAKRRNKKNRQSSFNKKLNKKIVPSSGDTSDTRQSPELQAESHLQLHRYKNAMDAFKRLLKNSPDNNQFKHAFQQASQGRCLQLAEKKMFKEASVIWENLQHFLEQNSLEQKQQTEQSPHLGDYLQWLLQSAGTHKALDAFIQHESDIRKCTWFPVLQSHFAAHLLLAPEQTLKLLASDHPLNSHCCLAKKALKAYCAQQYDEMHETLKKIPFRSAFKDLVLILKAELAPGSGQLLSKVPQHSAFYPFSQILVSLTFENEALLEKLKVSRPHATALLAAYLNWDKETLKAWNKIKQTLAVAKKSKKLIKKKVLLHWLIHLKSFSTMPEKEAIIQSVCRLLLLEAPSEYPAYVQRFGTLGNAEMRRIEALITEKHNREDALDEWEDFLTQTEKPLVKALVHRKMAELAKRMAGETFYYEIEEEYTPEYHLQQSLLYDPDDKDSYLQLLAIYGQDKSQQKKATGKQNKSRQKVINDALTHFPHDRNILIAAIKESQHRNAFKKAAALANRLLTIDPTNSFARQMLVESHLSHARKNLVSGKHHLVAKELIFASNIAPDSPRVVLYQGIFSFAQQESPEIYNPLINKAFELYNNPLLALLTLNTELLTARLHQTATKCLTPTIDLETTLSPMQSFNWINALFEQMQWYQNDNFHEFFNAFVKSDKLFKLVSKNIELPEQRIKISSQLIHFKHYPLAKWFVKFDKQLLKTPIMQYYQAIADSRNLPGQVTDSQFKRLETAYDNAIDTGDKRVANLLMSLLGSIEESRFSARMFDPYDDDDDDDFGDASIDENKAPFDYPVQGDLFAMMDEIMGNLSEAEKKNIMNEMDEVISGKISGGRNK